MKKDKKLDIRISEKDLTELQKKAASEDLPYQAYASRIIQRFLAGTLVESKTPTKIFLPDNLGGRSINENVIPTVCNLKNMLAKLKELNGNFFKLKPWEKRSYKAYQIDKVKNKILKCSEEHPDECWKQIIRKHILQGNPSDFGPSCIDIYLVAYVAETFGAGKEKFFQYVKEKDISQKKNSAQAIWQVGKGDGMFLEILNSNGTIKDKEFIKKWIYR